MSLPGGEHASDTALAPGAPLALFEENLGQWPSDISFVTRDGAGATLFGPRGFEQRFGPATATFAFLDGRSVPPRGEGTLPVRLGYFTGAEDRWQTHGVAHASIRYEALWPGIDAVFYRDEAGRLEFDFVVAPGADVARIRYSVAGAQPVLDSSGDLVLGMPGAEVRHAAPVAHQGGRPVESRFTLDGSTVGYEVVGHDPRRPLVIDPVVYASYVGDNTLIPNGDNAIAFGADSAGRMYIAGRTTGLGIPANGFQPSVQGGDDAFVAIIDSTKPGAAGLLYLAYLGGAGRDEATSLALVGGTVVVAGVTTSADFPVTAGAYDPFFNGGADPGDSWTAAIDWQASGASQLRYATFLGGSQTEWYPEVDARGALVAVTGNTASSDFPTSPGAYQSSYQGNNDGFAVVLNVSRSGPASLQLATYFGGAMNEDGDAIAFGPGTTVYVTGHALGFGFPVTATALQSTYSGAHDAFLTVLDYAATGPTQLRYSTLLGGSSEEHGWSVAVHGNHAYLFGDTASADFPTTLNGAQRVQAGSYDTFLTVLDPTQPGGGGLVYSTFLGGPGNDFAVSVHTDAVGDAYLAGWASPGFPISPNAAQTSMGLPSDTFVAVIRPQGTSPTLKHSTFLGGSGYDIPVGAAVDAAGNVYVGGYTWSPAFPVTADGFRTSRPSGAMTAFVARLGPMVPPAAPAPGSVACTLFCRSQGLAYPASAAETPMPASNVPPIAHITVVTSCTSGTVVLSAFASSDTDGSVSAWRWRLADGTSEDRPQLVGISPERAQGATLTVWDDDGAAATSSATVTAMPCGDGNHGSPRPQRAG